LDLGLAQPPAQQNGSAVHLARKVDESQAPVLELNAKLLKLLLKAVDLVGNGLRVALQLLGAVARLARARSAGAAIVEEVKLRNAELCVVGAPRRGRRGAPIFGSTVAYVLRASPSRVLVAGGRQAA
jgi:nucleotide-binding universal stress UspA family protein